MIKEPVLQDPSSDQCAESPAPIADLYDEAEDCRRKARSFVGRPEAPFLLRVARAFEWVADARKSSDGNDQI